MSDTALTVSDDNELRATLRAMLEAKFAQRSDLSDVQTSPYVASVCERLVKVVTEIERKQFGAEHATRYAEAFSSPEANPLLMQVVKAILSKVPTHVWTKKSETEKLELIRLTLSPYKVSEKLGKELLQYGPKP